VSFTTLTLALQNSFNGATPSQTWKLLNHTAQAKDGEGLQWSHAFSDVETLKRRTKERFKTSLQWSHAFSDVETA